jgi:hypothetical protein
MPNMALPAGMVVSMACWQDQINSGGVQLLKRPD